MLGSAKDLLDIHGHKKKKRACQHNDLFFSICIKFFRGRHKIQSELDLNVIGVLPGRYGSDGTEGPRNQSPKKRTQKCRPHKMICPKGLKCPVQLETLRIGVPDKVARSGK